MALHCKLEDVAICTLSLMRTHLRLTLPASVCSDTPFSAAACKPRLAGARRVSAGSAQRAHVTASTPSSSSSQTQRPTHRVSVCARIWLPIFEQYHAVLVLQQRFERPRHCLGVALLLPSRPFSDSATRSVPLPPLSVASDFRICPSQSKLTYDTLQNAALRPSLSTTIPQNPSFLTNSSFATGWLSFMLNLVGLLFTRKTRVRASKNASV